MRLFFQKQKGPTSFLRWINDRNQSEDVVLTDIFRLHRLIFKKLNQNIFRISKRQLLISKIPTQKRSRCLERHHLGSISELEISELVAVIYRNSSHKIKIKIYRLSMKPIIILWEVAAEAITQLSAWRHKFWVRKKYFYYAQAWF